MSSDNRRSFNSGRWNKGEQRSWKPKPVESSAPVLKGKTYTVTLNRCTRRGWNPKETGYILDYRSEYIGTFSSMAESMKCIKANKHSLEHVEQGTFYITYVEKDGDAGNTVYYDNGVKCGNIC